MTAQLANSNELHRKISLIDSLYLHSDLSLERIAKTVKMGTSEVQKIIESHKKNALEVIYKQDNVAIEPIMKRDVASLDCSKTALDAAILMIKKGVGCIMVTARGKPFGMVTERDILCEMIVFDKRLADLSLEVIASRPLICASPLETVGKIADLMMKNNIRQVPVVHEDNLVGIVSAKDLVMLLSSTKRSGLANAILEAVSHSRKA